VAATALLWTAGCQTRIGDLTVASPKNLPVEFKEIQPRVVGKDCSHVVLLLIPLGTLNPTIDGAIDDALAQAPGADALVNVSIKRTSLFAILYARSCVEIEGTAISTRS
jgi:hypothetical protein